MRSAPAQKARSELETERRACLLERQQQQRAAAAELLGARGRPRQQLQQAERGAHRLANAVAGRPSFADGRAEPRGTVTVAVGAPHATCMHGRQPRLRYDGGRRVLRCGRR